MHALTNFVAFQIGWFACVLGGAHGWPLAGVGASAAVIARHLRAARAPVREGALLAAATLYGAVFDSTLVAAGWLAYPSGTHVAGAAPYWIVAMWPMFATTLNVSLRWLHGRAALAALLGASGGPLAFLGGEALGGVTFLERGPALAALAAGWAIALPVLGVLARRCDGFAPLPSARLREARA